MRILIAAGGTGGHVYPALAVAEALQASSPAPTLTFVGTVGGFERPLVEEALAHSPLTFAAYDEVRAGPLHGISPLKAIGSLFQMALGTGQALRLMARHRPNAVLMTGGWVGLPVTLAAWLRRVPVLIYLPDVEPGLAIQTLRPLAHKVAVTTEDSRAFIPADQMVITGYPLRPPVLRAVGQRAAALSHFKLDPAKRTILVFGGSRGAQTINSAVLKLAPELLQDPSVQLLHITGSHDWARCQGLHQQLGAPAAYRIIEYLHDDMGLAFAAADLAICRSGASVLGELPAFSLPSILVPYPFAWRYQKVNADYLTQRGAALLLPDEQMEAELLPTIRRLLRGDGAELRQMRAASGALAVRDGAERVAALLQTLAGGG
jgi:UDP-N-acetylglucosamine--N-acetylmuramyl-(pentapeptide) pyrophosphoryl-undecaprenol N-acetylglucosamine transferase